jgi:hypothetical protein
MGYGMKFSPTFEVVVTKEEYPAEPQEQGQGDEEGAEEE